MTRERLVAIELTEKEMLLNAQATYLAHILLDNPQMIGNDRFALEAARSILTNLPAWKEYCMKMHDACVRALSTKNL